jgi:hypothetical protein
MENTGAENGETGVQRRGRGFQQKPRPSPGDIAQYEAEKKQRLVNYIVISLCCSL